LEKVKNVEGKVLIFVPLIDVVDKIVDRLKKDGIDKRIVAYHSKVTRDEKLDAIKKDIIVSTIKSCGVGTDIPGLRCIICVEPIASKIIAAQMIGRLRPYANGKLTYFFDVVDVSIPPINWWFRARFKKIQTLVKEVVYLNLDK
jgi:superfamily II DNA or RNA helicase